MDEWTGEWLFRLNLNIRFDMGIREGLKAFFLFRLGFLSHGGVCLFSGSFLFAYSVCFSDFWHGKDGIIILGFFVLRHTFMCFSYIISFYFRRTLYYQVFLSVHL